MLTAAADSMKFKLPVLFFLLALPAAPQSNHKVILNWSASTSTNVTGYIVFRADSAGTEDYTKPLANTSTCCMYTDTTVQPARTYFYTVEATDGTNISGPSNEVQAIVPVAPGKNLIITNSH